MAVEYLPGRVVTLARAQHEFVVGFDVGNEASCWDSNGLKLPKCGSCDARQLRAEPRMYHAELARYFQLDVRKWGESCWLCEGCLKTLLADPASLCTTACPDCPHGRHEHTSDGCTATVIINGCVYTCGCKTKADL